MEEEVPEEAVVYLGLLQSENKELARCYLDEHPEIKGYASTIRMIVEFGVPRLDNNLNRRLLEKVMEAIEGGLFDD